MAEGKGNGGTQPVPFIGVRVHGNRTAGGRRSSTAARRAARYLAFGEQQRARQAEGEGVEATRGVWYGPDGERRSHKEVMGWLRKEALQHRYTFEAILSAPQGEPTAQEFSKALQHGGEVASWRLMVHEDTTYRHAHVLFFGEKRLDREAFLKWQQRVREALLQMEQPRLEGQGWAEEAHGDGPDAAREQGQSWEAGAWM